MVLKVLLFLAFGISLAYDNLSRGKSTRQFQTWDCPTAEICRQYDSHNAIDEDNNSCMRTNTIRIDLLPVTWWYVDLGEVKSIVYVRILFKTYAGYIGYIGYDNRQRGRFAGFSLYLSNSTKKQEGYCCYIDGPELPPVDLNTTCIGHARYVIYYNERLPEGQYLEGYPDGYPEGFQQSSITELCDVDVQGCAKTGMYGSNCNYECPEHCQEKRCNILDGTCLGCKPGWIGDLCDNVCLFGKYGLECKQTCAGHCIGNASYDRVTGHCIGGCAAGWTGTLCDKECLDGSYGDNCMFSCSGHCLLQEPCDKVSGKCVNGCRSGYTNEKCDQKCTSETFGKDCGNHCSGHCNNNETCNYISGICDNGCADGYIGSMCDSACSKGHFGNNCTGNCSEKCTNTCHHVDGSCDCAPGWKGIPDCHEECPTGYFGVNCDHQCSQHCAFNDMCNRMNGSCPRGCQENYLGYQCQCKASESAVSDVSDGSTIGMSISIALNIIFLFVLSLPYIRALLEKRKYHKSTKTVLNTESFQTVKDADQQYQDLGRIKEASNYQELYSVDNKCVYQNH